MRTKGFTLIEILLVASIMLVITTLAIVSYNSYNDTEKVRQSALTFRSNLRFAQSEAMNGKKPASCEKSLDGYEISFPSLTTYIIVPWCGGEAVASEKMTYGLPNGVVFSSSYGAFTFLPLGKGVKFSTTPPIGYTYIVNNSSASITVRIMLDPVTGAIEIL